MNNSPDPLMVSWTMDCFFPVFLYLPVTCSDVVIVIQWPLRLDQSQGVKKSKLFFIIIIIVLTVHPLAVVNETRTPFVHFDFLGEHFGVTWKCEEVYMSCAAWTQILNLPSYSDSPFVKLTCEIFTFSMKSGQTLTQKNETLTFETMVQSSLCATTISHWYFTWIHYHSKLSVDKCIKTILKSTNIISLPHIFKISPSHIWLGQHWHSLEIQCIIDQQWFYIYVIIALMISRAEKNNFAKLQLLNDEMD